MKWFLMSFLLLTNVAFAHEMNLACTIKLNLDEVMSREITLKMADKDVLVGEYQDFKLFLTSMGDHKVELQILDAS